MMQIRIMRMLVNRGIVAMNVGMRLDLGVLARMTVLVMLVMGVRVLVFHRLMTMDVLVPFG